MAASESSVYNIFYETETGLLRFEPMLIECMEKKNNEAMQDALSEIENPQEAQDFRGVSLLHLAAEYDNEEIAKYLIELGFDVDSQDKRQRTALIVALKKQHFATAKVLLEASANVSACDTFGISALRMAIMIEPTVSGYDFPNAKWTDEYWQIIGMILDRFNEECLSDSEKVADQLLQMSCPLSHVVFMNNSEVMRIMIRKGSPINAQDFFTGKTPLHWAVQYLKLDKVKILLDGGADVDALNYSTRTPFMYIYYQISRDNIPACEAELVRLLLERKTNLSSAGSNDIVLEMSSTFKFGSKDAVRIALEIHPYLLLESYNYSLLHVVATNTNPGIEESIKGQKMDVHRQSFGGFTAIFHAVESGNEKMVECLLGEGASLEIADKKGLTPMHLPFMITESRRKTSPMEGYLKCLKVMLEHGGNPEIRFKDGKTILDVVSSDEKLVVLAQPVLAQLAVRRVLEEPISQKIFQQILARKQFKTYFDSCVNELEEATTMSISQSVSLFEFLTSRDEIVSFYARNRILVSKLSELIEQLTYDSYYMGILHKRFSKVSRIAELREKAVAIVCENLGTLYGCNSIVTHTIIDFLSDENVCTILMIERDVC